MSDILPKFKLYLFICFISFLINLSVLALKGLTSTNVAGLGLIDFAGMGIGSFVPFVSLTMLIGLNVPLIVSTFLGSIMAVMSGIQVFIIAMFVLQIVHNLIWNPDV